MDHRNPDKNNLAIIRPDSFCIRLILLFSVITSSQQSLLAANDIVYLPPVVNYSTARINAGSQNWGATQDASGVMYFANNEGLLSYDGVRWNLNRMPGGLIVRSVLAEGKKIYVGSYNEFGYFERDSVNRLNYHSLSKTIKDYTFTNEEIWQIKTYNDKVYFQSFGSYFIFDGEKIKCIKDTRTPPLFFYMIKGRLYSQLMRGGIAGYDPEIGFTEIISRERFNNDKITGIAADGQALLLFSESNGVFRYENNELRQWRTEADFLLKSAIVNRVIESRGQVYIIGTIKEGLIAIDNKGKLLWHINRNNGLRNNTVLGLSLDHHGNVWATLDNGIAMIRITSQVYIYKSDSNNIGMVYDMTTNGSDIYLATNQGVYMWDSSPGKFNFISSSQDQTWCIMNLDDQIIAGNNRGTLIINNSAARLIPGPGSGGTAMKKCVIHGREILLQSSYWNLSVFERNKGGKWEFTNTVRGFANLLSGLEIDHTGTIWAAHKVKGLYMIRLDESLNKVSETKSIPYFSDRNVKVMKLKGRVVFTCSGKFYRYDDITDKVVEFEELNKLLGQFADTYRIVSVNDYLYWFIRNSEYVLIRAQNEDYKIVYSFSFSQFDNSPIENTGNVFVDINGVSYLCMNESIGRYNTYVTPESNDDEKVSLIMGSVKLYNRHRNSVSYLNVCGGDRVKYVDNNITFDIGYPNFNPGYYSLQYKLDGFDGKWHEADDGFSKNYSFLPSGDYVFKAHILDGSGEELSSLDFPFSIDKPWYGSGMAILLYILSGLLIAGLIIKLIVRRYVAKKNRHYEEERKRQEAQLLASEQQILRLEKEKLENDLLYTNRELASAIISINAANELLEQLKEDILEIKTTDATEKRTVGRIVGLINSRLTSQDEWAVYQRNFDLIHENFFKQLLSKYPDLTSADLRLCVLLRMNMPTKDIARMNSLTIRGVEAARYRLRKHLKLDEKENLTEFIMNF